MAVAAIATGLFLLYLVRPYVARERAQHAIVVLFGGAAVAGALAAVGGLAVGFRVANRIRGAVEKVDALAAPIGGAGPRRVLDELGALDAAMGRLTLSMDRFIRDRDILARLPEGMFQLDTVGALLFFNATAETMLDSLERFRGVPIVSEKGLFPPAKGNAELARLLGQLREGRPFVHSDEVLATTATGRPLLLEVTMERREGGQGVDVYVVFFRDASEKRRIREQIRRADQLAFLGGLAARMAHEIRTPQATIRGLLELLQGDLSESDPRRTYIDKILHGVERQDRLVEDLLTLSHPEPETWQAIPLSGLVKEVLGLLPSDPRLTVRWADLEKVTPAWGDGHRLSQVITNLVRNAVDATPDGGIVEIRAESRDPEQVRLIVRNTGSGIPPELHERIFQPFFTTKPRGTGLGLAIARQIVEAHRGSLRVESDGTTETTFAVELPAATPALARAHT